MAPKATVSNKMVRYGASWRSLSTALITHLQSFFSCPDNCFDILVRWEINDTLMNMVWVPSETGNEILIELSLCPFGFSNGGRPPGGDRYTLVYLSYYLSKSAKRILGVGGVLADRW